MVTITCKYHRFKKLGNIKVLFSDIFDSDDNISNNHSFDNYDIFLESSWDLTKYSDILTTEYTSCPTLQTKGCK